MANWRLLLFSFSTKLMHVVAVDCQKSCVSKCEDGWEEEGGKCYFFSQDKLTWVGAEEECKGSHGSHLASVTDQQTHDFIVRKLEDDLWIGARQTFDESKKGSWAWADCSLELYFLETL